MVLPVQYIANVCKKKHQKYGRKEKTYEIH